TLIAMIKQLHLGRLRRQVFYLVVNHDSVRAGNGRVSRRQLKMRDEKPGFCDLPNDAQFIGWIKVDSRLDEVSRQIGDSAMQSLLGFGSLAILIGTHIFAGRPVRRESTAAKPFVKTLKPAQSSSSAQLDKFRMNRTAGGAPPSQSVATIFAAPY